MSEYMDIMKEIRAKEYSKLQDAWDSLAPGIYTITELAVKAGATFPRAKKFCVDRKMQINEKSAGKKLRYYIVKE